MIYLQQDFDLHPASPRTRDAFVALAQDALVAAAERHGARLIAAFFGNSERFFRITHFLELPSLGAFEAWRVACRGDAAACDAANHAEVLAGASRDASRRSMRSPGRHSCAGSRVRARRRRASTPPPTSRSRQVEWWISRRCWQPWARSGRSLPPGGPSRVTPTS